jgi:hypothetical protein
MMTFAFQAARRSFLALLCITFPNIFIIVHDVSAMSVAEYIAQHGDSNVKMTKDSLVFYDLKITRSNDPDVFASSTASIYYKNINILKDEDGYVDIENTEVAENFPLPGLRTAVVKFLDSEYRTCCWNHHVFVFSNNDMQHFVDPIGFSNKKDVMTENCILATAQHSLEGPDDISQNVHIFFSPAYHASYSRFLLYESGTWRLDKIGELKDRYITLLEDTYNEYANSGIDLEKNGSIVVENQTSDGIDFTYAAILVLDEAYYCIMSGQPDSACNSLVKKRLPQNLKNNSDSFVKHAKKEMRDFLKYRQQ